MLSYTVVVKPFQGAGETALKAFADVIIDDKIILHDFKIMTSKRGDLFVGAPSKKTNQTKEDGSPMYLDTVRFVDAGVEKTKENGFRTPLQDEIYQTILEEYKRQTVTPTNTSSGKSTSTKTPAKGKNPLWDNL